MVKYKIRELGPKAQKKEGEKMKSSSKRCAYCGNEMRARGGGDAAGGGYWKCKNKKCGRTSWEWKKIAPPIPLVYTGK